MSIDTLVLDITQPKDRQTAKQILREGGRVAIPTETVYGLGAIATNETAVKSVFEAKGRPLDHPLIVHIGNLEQLHYWVAEISDTAQRIIHACWPGPLTLIFKKHAHVSALITGGLDTIAIRMPALNHTRELIADLPHGLVAPSANPHKQLSPTSAEHVLKGLGGKIEAVLDGGKCDIGLESTILDVSGEHLQILRAGPISQEQLTDIAKAQVQMPTAHSVKVAGNMKAHYQPKTPLGLVNEEQLMQCLKVDKEKYVILQTSDAASTEQHTRITMPTERSQYGKALYHALHEADKAGANKILVEINAQIASWPEVMNRLVRAAHN